MIHLRQGIGATRQGSSPLVGYIQPTTPRGGGRCAKKKQSSVGSRFPRFLTGASLQRPGVLLVHGVAQCFEVIQCGEQGVERRLVVCAKLIQHSAFSTQVRGAAGVSETVCIPPAGVLPYPMRWGPMGE